MSWLSKLFGGKDTGNPGQGAQDLGMQEYLDAIKQYEQNGNNQYSWLGDFEGGPQLGVTEMDKIQRDPQLHQYELDSLRDLEQQSKDGLSARDLADLARTENQVNRANAGRIGAIQQNMAARGMGGSGLEMVQQMQANQDATEREALASLEKNAQAQEGRRQAMAMLGQQAGNMSSRDFQQQAQRAAAQDAINRFNTQNQWQQNQMNWQGRQGIANQNVAQNNAFQQNVLGAKQGGAQMRYNSGVEANNQAAARKYADQENTRGWIDTATNVYKVAKYDGGMIPGHAKLPGDHPANDTVDAKLSPGEIVIPRSIAQLEPNEAAEAAKLFVKLTHLTKGKK